MEHSAHCLGEGEPRTGRHLAADRGPPVAARLGKRPAGVRPRPQGHGLPTLDRADYGSCEGVAKGGYVLAEAHTGRAQVIVLATGSEVPIALAARELLHTRGIETRVVSLPCWEWFAAQEDSYRQQVLPPEIRARVAVEAASPMGWREWVGEADEIVGLDHYGASGPYEVLYEQFGITAERVAAAAQSSLSKLGVTSGDTTGS